jgi:hypothetical protein
MAPTACGRRRMKVLLRKLGLMDRGAVSVRAIPSGRSAPASVGVSYGELLSAVRCTWYRLASCKIHSHGM